jgi:hypothetical protein
MHLPPFRQLWTLVPKTRSSPAANKLRRTEPGQQESVHYLAQLLPNTVERLRRHTEYPSDLLAGERELLAAIRALERPVMASKGIAAPAIRATSYPDIAGIQQARTPTLT